MESAPSSSPLFATVPVVAEPRKPPLVVVGLPRSGSSFLSHVISTLDDWYVFDDLYLYQQAQAQNVTGPLTQAQLEKLVHYLGWTVRARIRFEGNEAFKPQCTWEDVDKMCEAVLEMFTGQQIEWTQLMEEWVMRLALHHGRSRWGYKTPQDFFHMDELTTLFPGVRFIFVMRDPRKMMSSIKYVPPRDGDRGQYHPLLYARYWKLAYRAYEKFAATHGDAILLVRFEDLVAHPDDEAKRIAEFLGANLSQSVPVGESNTSFTGGDRKEITPTEQWLCERSAGAVMKKAGYPLHGARPRLRDIPDFLATTCRFAIYQSLRLLTFPRARHQVKAFLKGILRA